MLWQYIADTHLPSNSRTLPPEWDTTPPQTPHDLPLPVLRELQAQKEEIPPF